MAQIIKEIRVDVSQPNVFQAIVAKQNDCNSRFLKITLTDCGVKISIETTAKVTINANRPDGQSQSFIGQANDDGTVTVPLAQWMLLVVGLLKCDVSVIDTKDSERLTTTTFYVDVQEAANSNTDYSQNPDGEFRVITPVTVVDKNSTDDKYPSAKAVYNYGQDILADTISTKTSRGSIVTDNTAKAPFGSLTLYGKTEKADNTLTTAGGDGSVKVTKCGKNFYNGGNVSGTQRIIMTNLNIPAGTYILSAKVSSSDTDANTCLIYDVTNSKHLGYIARHSDRTNVQITVTDTCDMIWFYASNRNDTGAGDTFSFEDIQIAPLDTSIDYEPYNGTSIDFSTPNGLASVGDVCDTLTVRADGTGKITQRLKTIVLNGSEAWKEYNNTTYKGYWIRLSDMIIGGSNNSGLCNAYPVHSQITTEAGVWLGSENETAYFHNVANTYPTLDEWKAHLAIEPITLIYPLETPTVTELSAEEVNAFLSLTSNKGTTNVFTDDICEVECTYAVDSESANYLGEIIQGLHSRIDELTTALVEVSATD